MDDEDEVEAVYEVEDKAQFWAGLDEIVTKECATHEAIDDTLRSFLAFTTHFKQTYLDSEFDVARACYKLLDSRICQKETEYVRRQILYCLLQEEDPDTLHVTAAFLLFDGRLQESCFELMASESAFARLVELIRTKDADPRLHRLILQLLFEMSRIQKLTREDLTCVDDNFILYLFQLIEELADDADDPYHYPVIRVLLVLNEQYMCLANDTTSPTDNRAGVTNRILKLLSRHGPAYRTFGENLILLLNRESELGPQLLILKLLYLLFTTAPTYEYFYTNDLHVLVDVIIRNLLDLDPGNGAMDGDVGGQKALRHTYLRVLCPLLKNTQLARDDTHYKKEDLRKLLYLLVNRSSQHFAPVDETVIRLVIRCKQIEWLREEGDEENRTMEAIEDKLAEIAPPSSIVANKLLGMSLEEASVSALSVPDVSANVTKQRPNVPPPRRATGDSLSEPDIATKVAKQKPNVPAPRRARKGSKPNVNGNGNGIHGKTLGNSEMLKPPPGITTTSSAGDISPEGAPSPFADEYAEG